MATHRAIRDSDLAEILRAAEEAAAVSLVGATTDGLASLELRAAPRERLVLDARDFGATGDGVTDDAPALQAFVDACSVLRTPGTIPPGSFRCGTWIKGRPDLHVIAHGAVLVKAFDSASGSTAVLDLDGADGAGADRVTVVGLEIDGSRGSAAGSNHCLRIRGCHDVRLVGLRLRDAALDGLYVGRDANGQIPRRLRVHGIDSYRNDRQGLSVTAGSDLKFFGSRFRDSTDVQAPSAGVDIEPNTAETIVEDIGFFDCDTSDNAGSGLILSLRESKTVRQGAITLVRHRSRRNGGSGLLFKMTDDLATFDCCFEDNADYGIRCTGLTNRSLAFRGGAVRRNGKTGVLFSGVSMDAEDVLVDGVDIRLNGRAVTNGDGIALDVTGRPRGTIRRFCIVDLSIGDDDPAIETQRYAVSTRVVSPKDISALAIVNVSARKSAVTPGATEFSLRDDVATRLFRPGGGSRGVTRDYAATPFDGTILADGTAGDLAISLPTAADHGGLELAIKRTGDVGDITVVAPGSETVGGEKSKVLRSRDAWLVVKAVSARKWAVIAHGGRVN